MATMKSKYSGSIIATFIAFFVPLLGGILADRALWGLIIGAVTAAAVWKVLGGKVDDLKNWPLRYKLLKSIYGVRPTLNKIRFSKVWIVIWK